jgi:hypothetical protein
MAINRCVTLSEIRQHLESTFDTHGYVDKCRHGEQGISYAWSKERQSGESSRLRAIDSHQPYNGGASARDRASEKKRWERINGIEGKKMRLVLLTLPVANTRESNRCI